MLSFLASAKQSEDGGIGRKGYGRWLLVIRISILTIGALAAFAALGIPMDRLTIILSALSVGIGFGLQGLINNLVSGLIISFEHPVRVGDTVEIGGQSGTVKSIGFRSSVITTPAGANVVIPNGNLLNQHLINWTRDTTSAAVDIPVGLPYGINLEEAMKMLTNLPGKDIRILDHPRPIVIIKQFNASSIDMQLTFWVSNLNDLPAVKTDIIVAIDRAFKQFGQVSPPQQEVEVSSVFQRKDS
jgi:small-conductance mechanosensitive channel